MQVAMSSLCVYSALFGGVWKNLLLVAWQNNNQGWKEKNKTIWDEY
jgi:hypothetical protein